VFVIDEEKICYLWLLNRPTIINIDGDVDQNIEKRQKDVENVDFTQQILLLSQFMLAKMKSSAISKNNNKNRMQIAWIDCAKQIAFCEQFSSSSTSTSTSSKNTKNNNNKRRKTTTKKTKVPNKNEIDFGLVAVHAYTDQYTMYDSSHSNRNMYMKMNDVKMDRHSIEFISDSSNNINNNDNDNEDNDEDDNNKKSERFLSNYNLIVNDIVSWMKQTQEQETETGKQSNNHLMWKDGILYPIQVIDNSDSFSFSSLSIAQFVTNPFAFIFNVISGVISTTVSTISTIISALFQVLFVIVIFVFLLPMLRR
jgi:hypothetical protein